MGNHSSLNCDRFGAHPAQPPRRVGYLQDRLGHGPGAGGGGWGGAGPALARARFQVVHRASRFPAELRALWLLLNHPCPESSAIGLTQSRQPANPSLLARTQPYTTKTLITQGMTDNRRTYTNLQAYTWLTQVRGQGY